MKKFTKESTLAEILKMPGAEKILASHKLPCVFCPMAKFEVEKLKVGHVCQMYGIDVNKILQDLNQNQESLSELQKKKK